MTSREKFEAWYVTLPSASEKFEIRIGDEYASAYVQTAWIAWQASRQQALEESAAEAESWKGQKLKLMAGEMSGPELRAARTVTTTIARVLRSRAEVTRETS